MARFVFPQTQNIHISGIFNSQLDEMLKPWELNFSSSVSPLGFSQSFSSSYQEPTEERTFDSHAFLKYYDMLHKCQF